MLFHYVPKTVRHWRKGRSACTYGTVSSSRGTIRTEFHRSAELTFLITVYYFFLSYKFNMQKPPPLQLHPSKYPLHVCFSRLEKRTQTCTSPPTLYLYYPLGPWQPPSPRQYVIPDPISISSNWETTSSLWWGPREGSICWLQQGRSG